MGVAYFQAHLYLSVWRNEECTQENLRLPFLWIFILVIILPILKAIFANTKILIVLLIRKIKTE